MTISFFSQILSGSVKKNQFSNADVTDAGSSRVFDPADLEMLKQTTTTKRETASRREFVALFRSRVNVVRSND